MLQTHKTRKLMLAQCYKSRYKTHLDLKLSITYLGVSLDLLCSEFFGFLMSVSFPKLGRFLPITS